MRLRSSRLLLILLWKNAYLQYRNPIRTLFHFLLPVLVLSSLIIVRHCRKINRGDYKVYKEFCVYPVRGECLNDEIINYFKTKTLVYSPSKNIELDKVMNYFKQIFKKVYSYKRKRELFRHFYSHPTSDTLVGLEFPDEIRADRKLPLKLSVKIRFHSENSIRKGDSWRTDEVYDHKMAILGHKNVESDTSDNPNYYGEGFLTLQYALVLFILKVLEGNNEVLPPIRMQRLPYLNWTADTFRIILPYVPLWVLTSYAFAFTITVMEITAEKEGSLKKMLRLLSVPDWLIWISWLVKSCLIFLIITIMVIFTIKINWSKSPVYGNVGTGDLLLLLILFDCSMISFGFLITVIFSKKFAATLTAFLLFVFSTMPFTSFEGKNYKEPSKLAACLLPNTALSFGLDVMRSLEQVDDPKDLTVWNIKTEDNNPTFTNVLLMLLLDTVIYLVVGLYLHVVFFQDGDKRPICLYRKKGPSVGPKQRRKSEAANIEAKTLRQPGRFEVPDPGVKCGIELKNLFKKFGSYLIVKDLNLKVYKGEITVLLGHASAGKSTILSMLMCHIRPSGGTAIINGNDIISQPDLVRQSIGCCLQDVYLFSELTAKENMVIFGKLRGITRPKIDQFMNKSFDVLHLTNKKNRKVKKLTYCNRQKLCVAVALLGDSPVILLDEPTSEMDSVARSRLSELLLTEKKNKTILMTTKYMDEADQLGDRIVILAGQTFQCYGTKYFLKEMYGTGYHLVISKKVGCDVEEITEFLKFYVPDLQLYLNSKWEITYLLPSKNSKVFEDLLLDLDSSLVKLRILSYGITIASFEEIFLRASVTESTDKVSVSENMEITNMPTQSLVVLGGRNLVTGPALITNQYIAMLKKLWYSKKDAWLIFVFQIVLPIIWIILNPTNLATANYFRLPERPMTTDMYKESQILLVGGNSTDSLVKKYLNLVQDVSKTHVYRKNEDIVDLMQHLYEQDVTKQENIDKIVVSASFQNDSSIIAWFNGDAFHAAAVSLGLVLNTVLKDKIVVDQELEFINLPIPFHTQSLVENNSFYGYHSIINAIVVGMAVGGSLSVILYVKERASKFKALQIVSGLNEYKFWIMAFLFEWILLLFFVIIIMLFLLVLDTRGLGSSGAELGAFFGLCCFYGIGQIPFLFFVSLVTNKPNMAFIILCVYGIFSGDILVKFLTFLKDREHQEVNDELLTVFKLSPFFSLNKGIEQIRIVQELAEYCKYLTGECDPHFTRYKQKCQDLVCKGDTFCCDHEQIFFRLRQPGMASNCLFLLVTGIFWFALVLLIDSRIFQLLIHKMNLKIWRVRPQAPENIDKDMVKYLEEFNTNQDEEFLRNKFFLVLKNVNKRYRSQVAVNGICLGMNPFECVGFLGPFEAGRSTMFQLINGEHFLSSGNIWIDGVSIRKNPTHLRSLVGYCPKTNNLLEHLTVRQTLTIFCLIRGISSNDCERTIVNIVKILGFTEDMDKKITRLSRISKRKVNVALAMVGDPPVVILDRPSSGLDPESRRQVWNAVGYLRDQGKCILISSDNIDECERLCTRVAFIVNGQFRCINSIQNLKKKFVVENILLIRLDPKANGNDIPTVEKFVKTTFDKVQLIQNDGKWLQYTVQQTSLSWSDKFKLMEDAKTGKIIFDYLLGESSLQKVFLSFAKK